MGNCNKTIFLTMLAMFLSLGQALAYDDGDFQVWATTVEEAKINKDAKVTLEEEFRFADDASDFYYQHYDIGYVYSANKHLDWGINYRQVYDKRGGKFREENRPHVNAILKWDMAGFKLEDRSRMQYRHFNYQTDFWQYRNKFTAKSPWKFTPFAIQPYLADEVFFDLNANGFSRNRFYSGFAVDFCKNFKGELYYLLQAAKSSGKWLGANALGVKLKLIF